MIDTNSRSFQTYVSPSIDRYAVILAGGEGSRLKSLTRAIAGDERPKQFCSFLNETSLLDETRKRISHSICPGNTLFSLTKSHKRFYQRPLWNVSERQMVVQPENKGTAPAILYSLMRLAQISSDSTVAFFPSDHYFSDEEAFMQTVESAFAAAEMNSASIILLGIEPEKAETSYGWIEPARSLFGDMSRSFTRVSRFWEKPTLRVAERLMRSGCLWNSFVMIGRVETFIGMYRKHLPEMYRIFAAQSTLLDTAEEPAVLDSIYGCMKETNFSSEVLEKSSDELMVMRVKDLGWCDWGEPDRVMGTLNTLGVRMEWMQSTPA